MAAEQSARWHKGMRPRAHAADSPGAIMLVTPTSEIRMPIDQAEELTAELMALLKWRRLEDCSGASSP